MSWHALFAPPPPETGSAISVPMIPVQRHGKPLLLLPRNRSLALQSLSLYPAQSLLAKGAKTLLRALIAAGLPLRRESLSVATEERFAQFLTQTAATDSFPQLAILAGNPDVRGQRFILLLFDSRNHPVAVVKAGIGEEPCRLIEREQAFLKQTLERNCPHSVVELRGSFHSDTSSAIALPFLDGCPPRLNDWTGVEKVMSGWLHRGPTTELRAIPAWQRLSNSELDSPVLESLVHSLGSHQVLPTLFHGDFAPWNVRQLKGEEWVVIDWERGEQTGVPGWDWFHWLIHDSILVLRHKPEAGLAWILQGLQTPAFTRYTRAAGIQGIEISLLASYLVYLHNFIVPDVIKTPIAWLRDAVVKQSLK